MTCRVSSLIFCGSHGVRTIGERRERKLCGEKAASRCGVQVMLYLSDVPHREVINERISVNAYI